MAIKSPIPSYERPENFDGTKEKDFPSLKTLEIAEISTDQNSQGDWIYIAVTRPSGSNDETFIQDIATIYKWGNSHFAPVKCGKKYPKDFCKIGNVKIVLFGEVEAEKYDSDEKVNVKIVRVRLYLDQLYIDEFLANSAEITTIQDLVSFHEMVMQDTGGTGGSIRVPNSVELFTGFK